jgi:hypothetical protein
MFGLKLDRLDAEAREAVLGVPGEGEDVLFGAGLDERVRLITLELRRNGSGRNLGDCMPGVCWSGVFAAAWSERRFSERECERRRASLFVDGRAGVPLLGEPPGGRGLFCIRAVNYGRSAARRRLCYVVFQAYVMPVKEC